MLLVPVFLLWLGSRPRRPRDLAWLALAPAGLAAYALYLGVEHGDAFAFAHAQEAWLREFAGPFVGIWDGAVAAWEGFVIDRMLFGSLVLAAIALLGTFRRLPAAYGAYALAALALPLSYPVDPQPLMSLPRFVSVLFPLFIWLAVVCEERGATRYVGGVFAVGLALWSWSFASWEWIS